MSFIAQITADISNFDKNVKKAVDITNDSTGKMDSKFANLGKSIAKIGVGVAAFGAAAIAAGAGLVKLGIKAGDAAARINNLSTATSLSTDVIQELSYVATASNSSFEGLSRSMDSFQRRLKTVDEEGSKVNEMLSKLGVSTTDTNGELRNMDDLLIDTFSRLGDMDNGLRKNAIGTELFGRSWNEVALIVSSGSKGIEQLRKEANELGLVIDKDTLKSADNFATAMGLVSFQVDKLKTKIGASLVPILENTVLPLLQNKVIPAISKVVESIANGVQSIIKAWGDLKAYFTTGAGADTFNAIVRDAIAFKEDITTVFTEIARTLNSIWASMGADLGDETETFLQTINRGFQNTLNLWRNLWIDFKKARASETLIEEFTNIGTMFSNFGKGLVADVVEPVDKVGVVVKDLTQAQQEAMTAGNKWGLQVEDTKEKIEGSIEPIGDLKTEVEYLSPAITKLTANNLALNKSLEGIKATMGGESIGKWILGGTQMDLSGTDGALTADSVWNVDNDTLTEKMKATADKVKQNYIKMKDDMETITIDMSMILTAAISDAFMSLGDAIVSGENILSSLGTSLLGAFGGILVSLGQMVTELGVGLLVAKLALKSLNPVIAIAGGAALIAIGSAFASGSRKLSQSMGSGGGYSSAPSMQSTGVSQSMPTGEFRDSYGSGQVEFKISGDNLVGVLNKKETRRNRNL